MNREQIINLAQQDPRFSKAVDTMEEMLQHSPIMPEDMDAAIQLLEFALNNPDKYGDIRAAAIKDGYVSEDQIPQQFDPVFIVSLLVALYGLQDRLKERGYARGGLAVAGRKLAAQGRGGDSMLAHINPREAEMLKRMGGAGTVNPNTGLNEYKSGIGKIFSTILPIALSFIAPGIGTAIGSGISGALGLGLGTAAEAALGAGVIGAGSAALGGGGLKGALIGGLTSGLGSYALGPAGLGITGEGGSLSKATDSLGLTGDNGLFGSGSNITTDPSGVDIVTAPAGSPAADAASAKLEAQMGGEMSPLTSTAVSQAQGAAAAQPTLDASGNIPQPTPRPDGLGASTSPSGSVLDSLKSTIKDSGIGSLIKYAPLALAAGSLLTQPKAVQNTVAGLSPSQQEYFNRPSTYWDWNKIQEDADRNNMSLTQYVSQNWNNLTGGEYDKPTDQQTVKAAHGGALSQVAYLARGSGSGRDDTINAKLSDGEYVIDAETVALLGDGSNAEGARRLDQMRKQIRTQKGKTLAKGGFSPDAKSPLAYLKGVA
jgi:hypothetical protein